MADMTVEQALETLGLFFAEYKRRLCRNGGHECEVCAHGDEALATLRAEIERLKKDAGRYRWLRDYAGCQLYVTKDEHSCNYRTAREWIFEDSPDLFHNETDEQKEAMALANCIWTIQWYPDTPIGSYRVNRRTLDAAIDAAKGASHEP